MKKQLRLKRWVKDVILVISVIELFILCAVEFESLKLQFVVSMFCIFSLIFNSIICEYY